MSDVTMSCAFPHSLCKHLFHRPKHHLSLLPRPMERSFTCRGKGLVRSGETATVSSGTNEVSIPHLTRSVTCELADVGEDWVAIGKQEE